MIEIGEYVINQNRLVIGQIIKINEERQEAIIKTDKAKIPIGFWNIKKHSKNIIDLIELYDYVNGMIVFDIITYDNGEKAIKIPSGYLISENEIQNILTHEQYMQNCYKCQDIENGTI